MNKHLSERQIDNYISRTLPPSELLEMDDHLAACDACMKKIVEIQQPSTVGFQRLLFAPEEDQHLTYEQMSGFVTGELSEIEREIVDRHRGRCDICAGEVNDLEQMREALGTGVIPSAATIAATPVASWYDRAFSSLFLRIAVPASALILIAGYFWFTQRNVTNETIAVNDPTPVVISDQGPPQNPEEVLPRSSDIKTIASLNDAGGKIELDTTGKLIGISNSDLDLKVRAALKDQSIDMPSDIRELRSSAGVLMGTSDNGLPFKINGPVGKVVETQRPTLSWQLLKDAVSYKVGIFDENFNQVAVSPELHNTSWTVTPPLKRGNIYQWQVTAERNGEEIKSPVRPAPEAKFKIVDQASLSTIEKVRRSNPNSHLLLGIAYANAGMLGEAEREFQALLKNNPNSEIAKKLLTKVRSIR